MTEHLFGVFALALVEMWAAIPLGFHLKLPPLLLGCATAAGALAGAAASLFAGHGLRRLIFWRRSGEVTQGRTSAWLAAKGPWAIGLLGPLILGPVLAAGLAGALGLPRAAALARLAIGIVLWTVVLVMLGALGMVGIEAPR